MPHHLQMAIFDLTLRIPHYRPMQARSQRAVSMQAADTMFGQTKTIRYLHRLLVRPLVLCDRTGIVHLNSAQRECQKVQSIPTRTDSSPRTPQ